MMKTEASVELWEWAEYYCPWCYIAAVRLHGSWCPSMKDG